MNTTRNPINLDAIFTTYILSPTLSSQLEICDSMHRSTCVIYCRWMLQLLIVSTYIQGIVFNLPAIWTSGIGIDGYCYNYYFWYNSTSKLAYAWMTLFWWHVKPLTIFVYCYGRIVVELRKRIKITPICISVGTQSTSLNNQSQSSKSSRCNESQVSKICQSSHINQSQSIKSIKTESGHSQANVVKTMLMISIAYAVTSSLTSIGYIFFVNGRLDEYSYTAKEIFYYVEVGLVFLNVCLDPIVYAASLDSVKQKIRIWFGRVSCHCIVTTPSANRI